MKKSELEQDFREQADRYGKLLLEDAEYAHRRYGLTMFYGLPPSQQWEVAETVLGEQEQDALYYFNEGTVKAEQGDLDGAIESLSRAVEMDRDLAAARYNLARCLQEKGEDKESARMFREYIVVVRKQKEPLDRATERELKGLEEELKSG